MSCRLVKVRMGWNEQRDFRSFFVPLEHHNLLGIMINRTREERIRPPHRDSPRTPAGSLGGGAAYVFNRVAQSPGINTVRYPQVPVCLSGE